MGCPLWPASLRPVRRGFNLFDLGPDRCDHMFDGLAPIPSAGEDGARGLDERAPGRLAVTLSGEARRTCLEGVRGKEQLREDRERSTQPLDPPLAAATDARVRQHLQPA